jgi:hypothetical protein
MRSPFCAWAPTLPNLLEGNIPCLACIIKFSYCAALNSIFFSFRINNYLSSQSWLSAQSLVNYHGLASSSHQFSMIHADTHFFQWNQSSSALFNIFAGRILPLVAGKILSILSRATWRNNSHAEVSIVSRVAGRNNSHAHGSNVSRVARSTISRGRNNSHAQGSIIPTVARSTISRGGPPTIAAAKQESAQNGTVDLGLFQLHLKPTLIQCTTSVHYVYSYMGSGSGRARHNSCTTGCLG